MLSPYGTKPKKPTQPLFVEIIEDPERDETLEIVSRIMIPVVVFLAVLNLLLADLCR